ncbi:26781_t:CDS:2 [Dentiscutata erythropus]|uniref:26781_t:CDS:1 n=1 Tax=Dentiscutata erythropus TaxID=1348616 RepID=A0A9N8ZFH2_9GLOM|nr:26781_t:CDS:2 [Dentiscutata erythropus]
MSYVVCPFVEPLFASDLVSPIFWRRRLLVDKICLSISIIVKQYHATCYCILDRGFIS